jgi:hypothetical protein
VEEEPVLSCARNFVRWVDIVKGFPTVKIWCKLDKWLRRYGEFRLDSEILIGFSDLQGKICVDDNQSSIVQFASFRAIKWWSLQTILTRLYFNFFDLQIP